MVEGVYHISEVSLQRSREFGHAVKRQLIQAKVVSQSRFC